MPEITFTRSTPAPPPVEDVVIVLTPAEAKILGDVAGAMGFGAYDKLRTAREQRAKNWTPYSFETVGKLFDDLYSTLKREGLLNG